MTRIGPFIALLLLTGAVRGDCENPSLVVDRHAEGVKYRDCWQVEYVVRETFPAEGLVQRLTNALLGQGWQTIEFDPVEPTASAQVLHAWTVHRAKDQDRTRVDQWMGWFIRDDQSRVQVTFRCFGRTLDDQSPTPIVATVTFISPQQWESRPK